MIKAMKTARDIRREFISYFEKNGHRPVRSSSLVPDKDPTLLFTNAGMNQFKDVFLGHEKRDYTRAVTTQKCVRAGGKHNDLEQVGRTARHHTFFEMLGNFSFGDYFKRDAIAFAWEFLTKNLGIPKDKLYVSVFREDDEAADIWHKDQGVAHDRIYRFDEADNFWQMGDTGPCGPCSEIFVDMGSRAVSVPDPKSVGGDSGRFVEIWNNVFMQFNKDTKGNLNPLPKPSVDTGMGLERLTAYLQGVGSNFDTDLFLPIINVAAELAKIKYRLDPEKDVSLRVMADHLRAMSFLIADGVLPSNEGRGYVLRRIMRRGIRHAHILGLREPTFVRLLPTLQNLMSEDFPELRSNGDFVKNVIEEEEKRFLATLESGLDLLKKSLKPGSVLAGDIVFKLYDTYGFPVDLTSLVASEVNSSLDMPRFEQLMETQREKSRASWKGLGEGKQEIYFEASQKFPATKFEGYTQTSGEGKLLGAISNDKLVTSGHIPAGPAALIVDTTPFYAQGGGQVGDTGFMRLESGEEISVVDTTKANDTVFLHHADLKQPLTIGKKVFLEINGERRKRLMAHHTATHLLQNALQNVLGNHVRQAGSSVTPDYLRFDFTHLKALSTDEIERVTNHVNIAIGAHHPVEIKITSRDEATKAGAMALFGEKYGEQVRMIRTGPSLELCGGTHVTNTVEIRAFTIVEETSLAAGVRRITAYAGDPALYYLERMKTQLTQSARLLGIKPENLHERIATLQDELKKVKSAKPSASASSPGTFSEEIFPKGKLVIGEVATPDLLKSAFDPWKTKPEAVLVILRTPPIKGRFSYIAGKNASCSINAGEIIKSMNTLLGGSGGGKPDLAQGGAPEGAPWETALIEVRKLLS